MLPTNGKAADQPVEIDARLLHTFRFAFFRG
jgi:hypothetical protein